MDIELFNAPSIYGKEKFILDVIILSNFASEENLVLNIDNQRY